jgi:hypothetical protein
VLRIERLEKEVAALRELELVRAQQHRVKSVRIPQPSQNLNTVESTLPLDFLVFLLYPSMVCKPVQAFPCIRYVRF